MRSFGILPIQDSIQDNRHAEILYARTRSWSKRFTRNWQPIFNFKNFERRTPINSGTHPTTVQSLWRFSCCFYSILNACQHTSIALYWFKWRACSLCRHFQGSGILLHLPGVLARKNSALHPGLSICQPSRLLKWKEPILMKNKSISWRKSGF